ncbi:MAG: hypothetical protein JWO38_3518, partial [Gemmataceae bacterium]|nr:hypothetical protein [Gemmataceae bacterium]
RATMIHLMLNRLSPDSGKTQAKFRYTRKPLQKAA